MFTNYSLKIDLNTVLSTNTLPAAVNPYSVIVQNPQCEVVVNGVSRMANCTVSGSYLVIKNWLAAKFTGSDISVVIKNIVVPKGITQVNFSVIDDNIGPSNIVIVSQQNTLNILPPSFYFFQPTGRVQTTVRLDFELNLQVMENISFFGDLEWQLPITLPQSATVSFTVTDIATAKTWSYTAAMTSGKFVMKYIRFLQNFPTKVKYQFSIPVTDSRVY